MIRLAPWLFLATVLLLAPAARGDRRAGIDYARGRAIVSFSAPVADAMQEYLEGRATLAQVCGDDSLSYLLKHFAVSRMGRLFDHDDWVIKNREDRTPAQAYWDDVRAVNLRFSDRRARAPTWVHHIATYGIFLLSFPEDQDVFEVCKAFEANPHVAYAESLVTMRLCYTPTDPDWGQLWGTVKINCQSAWDTDKGSGAVVAVLDTGVRLTHDDLKNKLWVNVAEQAGSSGVDDDSPTNGYIDDINGYDFGSGDANPSDNHGHGSHCSGTIGAEEGNSLGIAGVAFLCKIMACKIFGSGGPGDPVVNALNYARVMGADVTSNSYGSTGYSGSARASAINNCIAAGCLPIFAAGNSNIDGAVFYPASYFGVFSVAASTSTDARASFSCYGVQLDLTAPGTNIRSCTNSSDSSYANWQGTSMACPHVAGGMAVFISYLKAQGITLSSEQMRQVMRQACHDVNGPGWSTQSAYGRLDVDAMLNFSNLADVCEARISYPDFLIPVSGSALTVTGTARHPSIPASFTRYTLEYAFGKAAPDADRWELVTTSTTPVSGNLGTIDLTSLPPGRYTLRLTVENTHGQTFVDRIEFVRDILSDGTSGAAFLASATPVTQTGSLFLPRNLSSGSDLDWIRLELINGETYEFRTNNLVGDTDTELTLYRSNGTSQIAHNDDYPVVASLPPAKQSRIQWTCDGTNTYYLRCRAFAGSSPGSFDVTMTGLFRDAFERDETSATAAAHPVGVPADHNLVPSGDVDWASFAAVSGRTYRIACTDFSGATVQLYDTNGSTQIGSDATADGNGFMAITFSPSSSGTYFVRVDSSTSASTAYNLIIYEEKDFYFFDDFATVGTQLWTAGAGTWGIASGVYEQTTTNDGNPHFAHPDVTSFDDFIAEATVSYQNVNASDACVGLALRYRDSDDYIVGRIRTNDTVEIVDVCSGQDIVLATRAYNTSSSTDYHLQMHFRNGIIHLMVDGELLLSVHGAWYPGTVALVSYENESHFDDVAIYGFRPASTSQFAVSSPMPDGEFQETYSEPVPLAGGNGPFAHTILSGSLPPGLSMAADGSVTGTPTQIGSWTFDVMVVDSAGRVTAKSVDIDVADTTGPTVTINNPLDQDIFATADQSLDVDISDHSTITGADVRLNGGSWTPLTHDTGTHYTATFTMVLGSNIVDVRGIDSETNERIEQIEVFYDPSIPQVFFTSPSDGDLIFTSAVTLEGTFLNCVTVTVNGLPAALDTGAGTWSRDLTLVYGSNTITIIGTDSYGRTNQKQMTLHHYLLGDVDGDGDVDEDDALLAAKSEAGLVTLTASQMLRADVDKNSTVDIRDAYAIRRKAAGFPLWQD